MPCALVHSLSRLGSRYPGAGRLGVALGLAVSIGYPLDILVNSGRLGVTWRAMELGGVGVVAFSLCERWPRRLPKAVARWVVQVLAVGAAMVPANLLFTLLDHAPGTPSLWSGGEPLGEFGASTALALLIAPWTALAALIRQKDALVDHQALAFDLERSELEREALNARLHLLQAQVAPHFLFNTLANVQALVDCGSPRASAVLASLVAYLRAAVPRLNEQATTLGQELQLVEAYLELMHMRIPDRLQFSVQVEAAALGLRCPPMTLLTLAENAVRHGIDPSEEGGRIDIEVERRGGRCIVRVVDTGVGLRPTAGGPGTGLSTLRERLLLSFGAAAVLQLSEIDPHGVCAELHFPAESARRLTLVRPTALIADDEPLLREALASQLARAWPDLEVVAQARNGRDAVEQFEALRPDVCFLDVHMPGLSGVEAARRIGRARTSSSSPRSTTTPWRRSARARSTTWSSRSSAPG